MNREQRRRTIDTRCPRNREHRVLVYFNQHDPTQASWNCPKCETVGSLSVSNGKFKAVHPQPMTDFERAAWAQLLVGLV